MIVVLESTDISDTHPAPKEPSACYEGLATNSYCVDTNMADLSQTSGGKEYVPFIIVIDLVSETK